MYEFLQNLQDQSSFNRVSPFLVGFLEEKDRLSRRIDREGRNNQFDGPRKTFIYHSLSMTKKCQ